MAVRKAGYTGRVVIHVDVSAEGSRTSRPKSAFLANVTEVMEAIGPRRFRSAIRAGAHAAVPMDLNIDVFQSPR